MSSKFQSLKFMLGSLSSYRFNQETSKTLNSPASLKGRNDLPKNLHPFVSRGRFSVKEFFDKGLDKAIPFEQDHYEMLEAKAESLFGYEALHELEIENSRYRRELVQRDHLDENPHLYLAGRRLSDNLNPVAVLEGNLLLLGNKREFLDPLFYSTAYEIGKMIGHGDSVLAYDDTFRVHQCLPKGKRALFGPFPAPSGGVRWDIRSEIASNAWVVPFLMEAVKVQLNAELKPRSVPPEVITTLCTYMGGILKGLQTIPEDWSFLDFCYALKNTTVGEALRFRGTETASPVTPLNQEHKKSFFSLLNTLSEDLINFAAEWEKCGGERQTVRNAVSSNSVEITSFGGNSPGTRVLSRALFRLACHYSHITPSTNDAARIIVIPELPAEMVSDQMLPMLKQHDKKHSLVIGGSPETLVNTLINGNRVERALFRSIAIQGVKKDRFDTVDSSLQEGGSSIKRVEDKPKSISSSIYPRGEGISYFGASDLFDKEAPVTAWYTEIPIEEVALHQAIIPPVYSFRAPPHRPLGYEELTGVIKDAFDERLVSGMMPKNLIQKYTTPRWDMVARDVAGEDPVFYFGGQRLGPLPKALNVLRRHNLFIGSPGSGKTHLIDGMIHEALKMVGKSSRMIIFDKNDTAYESLQEIQSRRGFTVTRFGLLDGCPVSAVWDIQRELQDIKGENVTLREKATLISQFLFPEPPNGEDCFMEGVQIYFTELLLALNAERTRWSFSDAMYALRYRSEEGDALISRSQEGQKFIRQFKDRSNNELEKSYAVKLRYLFPLAEKWRNASLENAFTLKDWAAQDSRKVLIFPDEGVASRIMLSTLTGLAAHYVCNKDEVQFNSTDDISWFFLDELQSLPPIANLHELLNDGLSKGGIVTVGLECVSDLYRKTSYGREDADTLLSGFGNYLLFAIKRESLKWAQETFGSFQSISKLYSRSSSENHEESEPIETGSTRRTSFTYPDNNSQSSWYSLDPKIFGSVGSGYQGTSESTNTAKNNSTSKGRETSKSASEIVLSRDTIDRKKIPNAYTSLRNGISLYAYMDGPCWHTKIHPVEVDIMKLAKSKKE